MPSPSTVLIGNRRRLFGRFTDVHGQPVSPPTVTCKVRPPTGAERSITATAGDAQGVYVAEVDLDEAGLWHYRFESTSGVFAAGETRIIVTESAL